MNEQEKRAFSGDDATSAKDDLTKELEELCDMFQRELDNATNAEEEGEIIQDTADVESCEEDCEEGEVYLCPCCDENTVSDGEIYCDECRELMKHYPFRKRSIVAILAAIVVFALSIYYGADKFEEAIEVLDAKAYADSGKMVSAISALYSYTTDSEPESKKMLEIIVDAFCSAGYLSDATDYIQKVFTAEDLQKPANKKYKEIVDATELFIATQEATNDIVNDAFSGAEFDYETVAAALDAVADSYYDEENGIKYESVLTEYYKYELMGIKNMDIELQLESLKTVEAADKSGLYEWIYLAPLCEISGKLGDVDLAEEYFRRMQKNNVEDMLAYKSYASIFRYLETPDADAMIKICEEAKANAYQGDNTYLTILATAYLIKEQGALAYETMQEYMASGRYSVSDCNLYALTALYCGNAETYETMKATLEGSGYKIGETIEMYKNGEMSLAEVIADKRGDIG